MDVLSDIQGALVGAWRDDGPLEMLIGAGTIFDAPPKGMQPPYVTILRHDAIPRDADAAPGTEHRLTVHCWSPQPSRKAALEIAYRIEQVATRGEIEPEAHVLTLKRHMRTDTAIDLATGRARAAVQLRFYSEPKED